MKQLTDEGLAEKMNEKLEELERQGEVPEDMYNAMKKIGEGKDTSESETMHLMNFLFGVTPDKICSLRDIQN